MDQKNTIVKCKAHPDCLFNHNGVCDNYVINISADGKCECYVETATENNALLEGNPSCYECNYFADTGLLQCPCDKHEQYVYRKAPACGDFKAKRGQRAKCDFIQDMMDIDDKHLGEAVTFKMKVAELDKPNKNKSIISDWDYAVTLDTCKTCKKVVYGQPCKYKNVVNGVWTCYEEEIDEV